MESLAQILRRIVPHGQLGTSDRELVTVAGPSVSPPCATCNGTGWLSANVAVTHPDFGQVSPCPCQQSSANQSRRDSALERHSNFGKFRRATFADANPDGPPAGEARHQAFTTALTHAAQYADHPNGWFTIAGPSGSGKTYLAAAIANRRIDLGEPALMITASDLLDQIRAAFDDSAEASFIDMFDHFRNTPFLILDDLPSRPTTQWEQDRLLQLLAHRHSGELPTVITLRGNPEEVDDFLQTRLSTADGFARMFTLGKVGNAWAKSMGRVPLSMQERMTFEAFRTEANDVLTAEQSRVFARTRTYMQRWAKRDDPEGWLLLMGPCGVGKTHLAVAAAVERQKRGDDVFYATVADLLDHLRSTFSPDSPIAHADLLQRIRTADLLVLDDMGAERNTPFAEEKLFQIINHRYEERLPTIVTTSALPIEIDNTRPRVASRLLDQMVVTTWVLEGQDYRRRLSAPG